MTMKKDWRTQPPVGDEGYLQQLLTDRQTIAEQLHACTSRVHAERILGSVFSADEATQLALIKLLVRERDVDAADLLLAINELAPRKVVHKEARRALIQLAGAKIYPGWTPEPEPAAVGGRV